MSDESWVRELLLRLPGGRTEVVRVVLSKPEAFSDGRGYYCPYQIVGFGMDRCKYAAGADPIQALQIAMQMIGVDLEAIARTAEGRFEWDGMQSTGFPVPV